jgi:hypothetical protein
MRWSDLRFSPSDRELRQFAALWIVFFGGLAAWRGFAKGDDRLAWLLGGLAGVVGLLGLWRPRLVRPIYVGWMVLAFPIGWTVSHLILAAVFYLVFTPVALVFRLKGRDALQLRRPAEKESYWSPKPPANHPRRYYQQF